MLNKNVADYTDFEGKTNKKIVQAPGGASSFSLNWGNEPKPEPRPRKPNDLPPNKPNQYPLDSRDSYNNYNNYNPQNNHYTNPNSYSNNNNYSQPIKVMEEEPRANQHYNSFNPITGGAYSYGSSGSSSLTSNQNNPYGNRPYPPSSGGMSSQSQKNNYGSNQGSLNSNKYGGEYGYNNYIEHSRNAYEQDALDVKMEEHLQRKNTPQSVHHPNEESQQSGMTKPSIRIHEQHSNIVLGDNSYNYWKDTKDTKETKAPYSQQQPPVAAYKEKTSVRVHNPPGGRSSFTLG